MNPYVWRFIGGFATSMAIDAIVPDLYKHAAQGANVAIWGKGTLRGRGSEAVGRGMTKLGAKAIRSGPVTFLKIGTRFVPVVGWAILAVEAQQVLHHYGVQGTDLFPPYVLSID